MFKPTLLLSFIYATLVLALCAAADGGSAGHVPRRSSDGPSRLDSRGERNANRALKASTSGSIAFRHKTIVKNQKVRSKRVVESCVDFGHTAHVAFSLQLDYDADAVLDYGKNIASHSWEYGVMSEALMDWYNPSLSVFSSSAFANGKMPKVAVSKMAATSYAIDKIDLTRGDTLVDGAGANGDPASLVPAALYIGQTKPEYLSAVDRQIQHLYNAPRYSNGAISQRDQVAELWADGMYMIHPALAIYAVQTQNTSHVLEAARQAGLYRQILQAKTSDKWKGMWTHIVGPQSQTLGIWLTGNGWAAMGMARVLATLVNWPKTAKGTPAQQSNLKNWIYEILSGAQGSTLASNGLLRNYIVGGPKGQDAVAFGQFGDATGTAMIAAVAYRMAVLDPSSRSRAYISWADGLRKAVAKNVQSNGLVTNTVDPLNWYSGEPYMKGSPEGQGSAALLLAAYRDYLAASSSSS